jgi:hypothetical protein
MSAATSFSAMAQQLAQSLGVGLSALVVHLHLIWYDRTELTPDDIAMGFFTIGLLALSSTIIYLLLPAKAGAELAER